MVKRHSLQKRTVRLCNKQRHMADAERRTNQELTQNRGTQSVKKAMTGQRQSQVSARNQTKHDHMVFVSTGSKTGRKGNLERLTIKLSLWLTDNKNNQTLQMFPIVREIIKPLNIRACVLRDINGTSTCT